METPNLAIAVVSWNTRDLLARCLRTLEGLALDRRALVWVVDNGSGDGSPEMVRAEFSWARLVEANENLGFGAAVNIVAAETATEWLAAANADIELSEPALDALIAAGARRPDAGALAPRLELSSGSTQRSIFRFPRVHHQALAAVGAHRLSARIARELGFDERVDRAEETEVDYAMGAFLLFRREAFDAVGGFDAGQWMYAEDLDVCWRLRRAGWKTVLVPAATVRHVGGAAADLAFAGRVPTLKLAAHFAWIERRRGRATMWAIAGLNLAGAGVRLALLYPLASVRPGRWMPAFHTVREWARMNRCALAARHSTRAAAATSSFGAGAIPGRRRRSGRRVRSRRR